MLNNRKLVTFPRVVVCAWLSTVSGAALAQETQPGDACIAGQTGWYRSSSKTIPADGGNIIFCDGSTWQSLIVYNATGDLTFGEAGAITLPIGATAERPSTPVNGMMRYNSETNSFEVYEDNAWTGITGASAAASDIFEVNGAAGSEVVSSIDANVPYATADFVFGSPQLADDTIAAHDSRMFFDKSKGAFRAGWVTGTQWNDANVGNTSVAMGALTTASGDRSVAMGYDNIASGSYSSAIGGAWNASTAFGSVAMGRDNTAGGNYSFTVGQGVRALASNTFAFGLSPQSTTDTDRPQVSGEGSMGIFMDTVDSYNLSATDTFGIIGGEIMIDDDGTSAATKGCIRYDDTAGALQFSHDCSTYFDMGASSSSIWQATGAAGSEVVNTVDANAPYATADFVFGSPQLADDTNTDHDARMFFDKSKGAFRAGTTPWGSWDDANVGTDSTAFGLNTTASGARSTALGYSTIASGSSSVAMGSGAVASASSSLAMGFGTTASGNQSAAMGQEITTSATNTFAIGLADQTDVALNRPQVSGEGSMGIFMDTVDSYDLSATDTFGIIGGEIMIDDDGTTPATKGCLRYDDTAGALQFSHDCSTYYDMGASSSSIWQATGAAGSEVVNTVDANAPYATADFVFGSPTLDYDSDLTHAGRVFYNKAKSAFRAGYADGTDWDDANVGESSFAAGYSTTASGDYSTAMGIYTTASGSGSTAMGNNLTASGNNSTAMGAQTNASGWGSTAMGNNSTASGYVSTALGHDTTASGWYSTAIGNYAVAGSGTALDGAGDGSVAMGLIDNSVIITTKPMVTGIRSMGIFMGDQDGVDMAADNTMGLFGGKMVIDPAVPATNLAASTGGDQDLELDVEGDIGAINYCDEDGNNCFASSDVAGLGSPVFEVTGAAGSEVVNTVDANAPYATADFVFGSAQLADDSGTTNDNNRMFFDKSKAAFRAGVVTGGHWDDANVGTRSTALGYNVIASGYISTALGASTYATGDTSTAIGNDATAAASYSIAMGLGEATGTPPQVSGTSSFGVFMGDQTGIDLASANTMAVLGGDFVVGSYQLDDTTTGSQDNRMFFDVSKGAFRAGQSTGTAWDDVNVGASSFASGLDTRASGNNSTAIGYQAVASGNRAIAIGGNTTSSGVSSMAIGAGVTASSTYSTALGYNTTSSGSASTTMGMDTAASGDYSMAIGLGDATTTNPIVSGASSMGIFMGDQSGVDITAANTMAIMGGKVGIGMTNPDVELDVEGDIEYTGTLVDVSDRRLKKDIQNLPQNQLDKITALQGVSFKMRNDPKERTEFGFIAQDVKTQFPVLVHENDNGMLSLNYVGFIAPMVESIKTLKAENDDLRSSIEKLSSRLEKLEAKSR